MCNVVDVAMCYIFTSYVFRCTDSSSNIYIENWITCKKYRGFKCFYTKARQRASKIINIRQQLLLRTPGSYLFALWWKIDQEKWCKNKEIFVWRIWMITLCLTKFYCKIMSLACSRRLQASGDDWKRNAVVMETVNIFFNHLPCSSAHQRQFFFFNKNAFLFYVEVAIFTSPSYFRLAIFA